MIGTGEKPDPLEGKLRGLTETVNQDIDALEAAKRNQITSACSELGLSEELTWFALMTTCDVVDFERLDRPHLRGAAKRFKALRAVRDQALALANALGELDRSDSNALGRGYQGLCAKLGDIHTLSELKNATVLDVPQIVALSVTAHKLAEQRSDDEGKGGRPKVLDQYSDLLEPLAHEFEEAGLPVGRGGAFERLCAAIFDAAGVRAAPEGAIRNLMKWKKP